MKFLFYIKNKIDEIYAKAPMAAACILRFLVSFLALLAIKTNFGFNSMLSTWYFVILFSIVCAFLPLRIMMFALAAYCVVQIFTMSAGIGIVTVILLAIMYITFFRFDKKMAYVIVLIPLLCMIRLPILIPLVLAVTMPSVSVISAVFGIFTYYFLHYLHMNTAMLQGLESGNEIAKMSVTIGGVFGYSEMWYTILCIAIVFAATFLIKKVRVNMSNQLAIALGSGVYLILIIICNLAYGTMTYSRLLWFVIGTVISCIVAMTVSTIVLPLDYNRTEFIEFEDEEYKYYVRAVPKAAISKESVKIKRIYSRKEMRHTEGKERES